MLQLISHQPVMRHRHNNTNVIVVSVRPAMISNVDSKKKESKQGMRLNWCSAPIYRGGPMIAVSY